MLPAGQSPDRKEQFRIVTLIASLFMVSAIMPVISIDTKKKEALGMLTRDRELYCIKPPEVFDHDYSHLSIQAAVPHGIYDIKRNFGYITIGISHETADFVTDNIEWWWTEYGIHNYPEAKTVLILCDCGGANSYRHHRFKKRLQDFTASAGIKVLVANYPPYCSKYKPIERLLFCHVHRAIANTVLTDVEMVKERIATTSTKTGLKVKV